MREETDAPGAKAMIAAGGELLDVREQHEWDAGHAPEAVHIPMSEIEARIGEVNPSDSYAVICRSGGRSARVVAFLAAQGITAVNVAGGMHGWVEAGYAVVTDDGSAGSVA